MTTMKILEGTIQPNLEDEDEPRKQKETPQIAKIDSQEEDSKVISSQDDFDDGTDDIANELDEGTTEDISNSSEVPPQDESKGETERNLEENVTSDNQKSSQAIEADRSDISNGAQLQTEDIKDSTVTTVGRDVNVNVKEIKANTVNVLAPFNQELFTRPEDEEDKETPDTKDRKAIDTEKLTIIKLETKILQKVKAVFVVPPNYDRIPESFLYENRIFAVYGQEHAGKFTCAVHLGMKLCEKMQGASARISIYNRTIHDSLRLIDVVQSRKFQEGTVCIVEDAFEHGVDSAELSSPYVPSLSESLRNKSSYLILTTTLQTDKLATLEVQRISAVVDDIPRIFTEHLNYYERDKESLSDLIKLSRQEHEKLEEKLKQPFQVDLFCKELSRRSLAENINELVKIAEWVGHIAQENPHSWFTKLSPNARLYAMLVVLFEGIERLILDEFYIDAIQRLREKGVSNLCEPREIGLDDIIEKIRAQENEAHMVQFNNRAFEEEVRRQIMNYHHLLWLLLDMVRDLIDKFKAREYWKLRKALGVAIGRLGIYHLPKLEPVIQTLAQNEHGGVVAVVGSALDEICRTGSEYYPFVTSLLERWVKSKIPDLMWAVAASLWRIYDTLAFTARSNNEDSEKATNTLENIRSIFTELVETFDQFSDNARFEAFQKALEQAGQTERAKSVTLNQFVKARVQIEVKVAQYMQNQLEIWARNNLRAIVHAIRQIALTHPQSMIELITKWLQTDEESNLYIVGKMAGYQLFQQYSDPEIQLLKERHLPLLDLVHPLLSTFDGNPAEVDMMMRTLAIWLQRPGWTDKIHTKLLPVVNRLTPEEAAIFRAGISHQWFESGFIETQRVGQALIARSYLMEGVPMLMPKQGYGVIAIDASFDARMNNAARAGCRLYERLDPQIDMYVVRIGQTKAIATPGQMVGTVDFEVEHNRPRLLVPPLEEVNAAKAVFTLAVTWNPITDIDDIQGEEWAHRLMIASAENKREYSEKIAVIPMKRHISEHYLHDIEAAVRARLSQTVASAESGEWEEALHEHSPDKPLTKEAIVIKLNSWINELNDIKHAQHPGDVARIVVCTILWLASKDLPGCVEVVKTWLSQGDELHCLIGMACGKTLFKVYAHREPIPDVETYSCLLELAPLLADKHNWGGVEAVLYAARRWAVQPEWFKRFLNPPNGEPGELFQLVEEALPEHYEVLLRILKEWHTSLNPNDEEPVPDTVINLAVQLQLWVALKMRQSLPELQEGHQYGLIVLDAAERNSQIRNFFADVTSNLIEELDKRNHKTLELIVYRMGEKFPVAMPKQKTTPKILLPRDVKRPRLLCPLIETHAIENVKFILLFTNNSILDQNDWLDTNWNEHIHLYSQIFKEPQFSTQSEPEDIVPAIIRYLEREIGV